MSNIAAEKPFHKDKQDIKFSVVHTDCILLIADINDRNIFYRSLFIVPCTLFIIYYLLFISHC